MEKRIRTFIQNHHPCPFKGKIRFEIIKMTDLDPKEKKKLGTYGFIQGAKYFIVGIMNKSQQDLEYFGYIMEKIILFLTDLELATCWVGGTLRRNNFADQITLNKDEFIPAITPVGYPAEKRSKIEKFTKFAVRGKKDWKLLFFEGNFRTPLPYEKTGQYQIPLEMVRLSPSAGNNQPVRIIKEKKLQKFHFYLHRRRIRGKILSIWPDFPRMDLGIAICHFNLTSEELGLKGEWSFSNPNITLPTHHDYIATWIED
jgi:hypothetical protein